MTSVSSKVIELATLCLLVQNSTPTATTHSGGRFVLQVTLTPGVESSTLSALTSSGGSNNSDHHSPNMYIHAQDHFKHVQWSGASYLVPEREHDVCPPTSMQLLSTNKAYDGNPLAMSVN